MSSFRDEIAEQPEVAGRLLQQMASVQAIGAAIKAANPAGILIAARGSSDNAAVYAKYVFQFAEPAARGAACRRRRRIPPAKLPSPCSRRSSIRTTASPPPCTGFRTRCVGSSDTKGERREMAALIQGSRVIVLGRGFNLATAEELALKLTETSYVLARAWSAADFLHGPIAVMDPGFPVILVEAQGPTYAETREVFASLAKERPQMFQIGDGTQPLPGAAASVLLESGLPESLTPLTLAVAGQLLALHLALSRGLDPDQPRTLTKVTRTR